MNTKSLIWLNVFFGSMLALILLLILLLFYKISEAPNYAVEQVGHALNSQQAVQDTMTNEVKSSQLQSAGHNSQDSLMTEIVDLKVQIASIRDALSKISSNNETTDSSSVSLTEEEREQRRLEAQQRKEERDFAVMSEFEAQVVDEIWLSLIHI